MVTKLLLLALFFVPVSVAAQTSPLSLQSKGYDSATIDTDTSGSTSGSGSTNHTVWGNLGMGESTIGMSLIAGISYQFNAHILSLRGFQGSDFYDDNLWDLGFLYGRGYTWQNFHISSSMGLSVMGGERYIRGGGLINPEPAEYEPIDPAWGLAIESQAFFRPFRIAGIGLHGFAGVNGERSFAGVALSLQVGKLR